MDIKLVKENARYKRGHRRPKTPFHLKTQPWQVQPFCIFPVIPGETMRKLSHLSRTYSDPIKNRLMGMHIEHSYFYVKHTDLAIASDVIEMHMSNASLSAHFTAADPKYFHRLGLNWLKLCVDKVVEWYFRDHDETGTPTIGGMPAARITNTGWWDSVTKASDVIPDDTELVGENPQLPPGYAPYQARYDQWLKMVDAGLTEKTFEDYLASFGVRVPTDDKQDEEVGKPELLRHVRQWTYPTNTVEPTTGQPSSAVVWSCEHDASRDRFFKEPGFVVGVQVVRPKVHLAGLTGSLLGITTNAESWLPATLWDLPAASLRQFSAVEAIDDGLESVWIDMKDLFLHGEEFRNHSDDVATVALPTTGWQKHYASEADATALFVNELKKHLWTDGIVTMDIATAAHRDTTPTS